MEFEALDPMAIQLARADVRALADGTERTLAHERRDPDMARSVELLVGHEKERSASFDDETRLAVAIVRMETDRDALVEEDVIGRARFAIADIKVMRQFSEIHEAALEGREPKNGGPYAWLAQEAVGDEYLMGMARNLASGRYDLLDRQMQEEIREDLATGRKVGGPVLEEQLRQANRAMGDWRGEIVMDRRPDALAMADEHEARTVRAGVAAQAATLPKASGSMPRGADVAPKFVGGARKDLGEGR